MIIQDPPITLTIESRMTNKFLAHRSKISFETCAFGV